MKYPKCVLSVVIISIGAILGVITQNDLFEAFLGTLLCLVFLVPLALILGLIALVFLLARQPIGKWLSYSLVVSCSCIVSLVVLEETGSWINKWKVTAVESYVAHAVPVLDQIKQKEGSYPAKLPIDLLGEPPELLEKYGKYNGDESTFYFEYEDEPAGWAGGEGPLMFDSTERKWR